MTAEPSRPDPHTGPLTDLHRSRIDFARRDFEYARAEDLAHLEAAGLILMIERLRSRLGDMLDLIGEVCDVDQANPPDTP